MCPAGGGKRQDSGFAPSGAELSVGQVDLKDGVPSVDLSDMVERAIAWFSHLTRCGV